MSSLPPDQIPVVILSSLFVAGIALQHICLHLRVSPIAISHRLPPAVCRPLWASLHFRVRLVLERSLFVLLHGSLALHMEWNGPGTLTIFSEFLSRGLTFSFSGTGNSFLLSLSCGLGRPMRRGKFEAERVGPRRLDRERREDGRDRAFRNVFALRMECRQLSCAGAMEEERKRAYYCTYR